MKTNIHIDSFVKKESEKESDFMLRLAANVTLAAKKNWYPIDVMIVTATHEKEVIITYEHR